jgi:hypothetical protein
LQKVSAICEKLIGGGTILAWMKIAEYLPGFTIQKVGAGIMDLCTLAGSSANWDLAARIG